MILPMHQAEGQRWWDCGGDSDAHRNDHAHPSQSGFTLPLWRTCGPRSWLLLSSMLVFALTTWAVVSSMVLESPLEVHVKRQFAERMLQFSSSGDGGREEAAPFTSCGAAPVTPRIKELQKLQVAAIVFYGRRRNVRILNTYLERNLVSAGGILHEVRFVVKTEDEADLKYLHELLDRHPRVYRRVAPASAEGENKWARNYDGLAKNRLYIKIDDDIVFIQDGAIPSLVEAKLRSRFLFLSANVVNHPLLSHVHARMGAILPFVPVADLSQYCTEDRTACEGTGRPEECRGADCEWRLRTEGPDGPDSLEGTFAGIDIYANLSTCFLNDWRCAAMAHHSFLYHNKRDNLQRFHFPSWDFSYAAYDRWSINFFIFNSSDIPPPPLPTDDEVFLGQHLPAYLHKHCGAVGEGTVVVHYGYFPQTDGLLRFTRLLSKYEKVAKEVSRCPPTPTLKPMGDGL